MEDNFNINDFDFNVPSLNDMQFGKIVENNALLEEMLGDITPIGDLMQKQIDLQELQIEELKNNYNKLNKLYKIKEKENIQIKQQYEESKKYNKIMMWIAIISGIVGICSLFATILIAILK